MLPRPNQSLNWFGYSIGLVIAFGWLLATIIEARGGPRVPMALSGLMAIVSGAVFGDSVIRARTKK